MSAGKVGRTGTFLSNHSSRIESTSTLFPPEVASPSRVAIMPRALIPCQSAAHTEREREREREREAITAIMYSLRSEAAKIDNWIQECIVKAQEAGAKVIALALLNKDWKLDMDEVFMSKKGVNIPIVTGETLAAAIVAKEVEAEHANAEEVFLTSAHSRLGRAICTYLCEHGFKVLALLPSKDQAEDLQQRISAKYRDNLVHATNYNAGKNCKVWIVGEQINNRVQKLASSGTHFHQFSLFPICKLRKDCTYGRIPGLHLPDYAKNINGCEDVMPRYVVRASYASAILHTLEGWRHHDLGEDISIPLMNESWNAALKHGFSIVRD